MVNDVKRISAEPIGVLEYGRRVWKQRMLVYILTVRDLKAAYAQTKLGWIWLIIKPLTVLLLFTIFFDNLLSLDTGSIHYPAFAFSGMSLWYFFSNLAHNTGSVLQQSTDLMSKIYFPRIILLLSKSGYAVLELAVHLVILIGLLLMYGYSPSIQWLVAFPMILLVYGAGLAVGIWLNNLSIQSRDMQHLIPQLVNLAIWLTPVFYPLSIIPKEYHGWLYVLNPIATAIDGLRFSLFNVGELTLLLFINVLTVVLLLVFGLFTFIQKERNLIDRL